MRKKNSPISKKKDEFYMGLAIDLAKKARPSPNPRVGALLVKNGKIIGKGYHRKAGEPHAEINAINSAKRKLPDLSGSTLYITLEPCCHYGKTPPCTNRILAEKIGRVVIGAKDPNRLVAGRGISILRKNVAKITAGVLSVSATEINDGYNHFITTGWPLVVLKAAISLDGKISAENRDSKWISNRKSRRIVHEMRSKYDAILVGSGTVLKDNPRLTSRIRGGIDPMRIIFDSKLSLPLNAKVLADRNAIIFTTAKCNKAKKLLLEKKGYEIQVAGNSQVDLKKALSFLGKRGITGILVEGGAKIYGSFINQKLADKVILFIAPNVRGGQNAPVFPSISLKNPTYTKIDDNVMIEGDL